MVETLKLEERIEKKVPVEKPVSLGKIMVATDFSPVSRRALDYAVSLARRFGSRIYLTNVITFAGHPVWETADVPVPTTEDLRSGAEKNAKEIVDSGCFYGVPHEVIVEEGALWPTLGTLIEKHGIDLLVLGTHGMSGALKVVFGSCAEEIFRHARIPVLTVGPAITEEAPFEAEFKNILCATAFGPAAEREAAFAYALAQEHRARLVLLHVARRPDELFEVDDEVERESVGRRLQELLPTGDKPLCKVEYEVAHGEPVPEILNVARAMRADLIVIGAKKRESLAGHMPFTKAFGVVRGAHCPVLTIKS